VTTNPSAARDQGARRVAAVTGALTAVAIAGALAVAGIAYADHKQDTATTTTGSTDDSTAPSLGTTDDAPHATSGGS
jgi:hypothetical protein